MCLLGGEVYGHTPEVGQKIGKSLICEARGMKTTPAAQMARAQAVLEEH